MAKSMYQIATDGADSLYKQADAMVDSFFNRGNETTMTEIDEVYAAAAILRQMAQDIYNDPRTWQDHEQYLLGDGDPRTQAQRWADEDAADLSATQESARF